MSDQPVTKSKDVICRLIREYGHVLPEEQREALQAWCGE